MSRKADTGADAIYDSGFTSHAPRSNVKLEKDPDVLRLYYDQIATPSLYENWNYKERVLETAASLLFPLQPWALAQRANTMHSKHALLFVRDLLQVAVGGDRSMSVRMRTDLMTEASVLSNPLELRGDLNKIDQYLPFAIIDQVRDIPAGTALANLTDTPEKLKDLVQSLYVMFGTGR